MLIFEGRDNDRGIAASALRQIGSYLSGRNGLANNAVDGSYRPSPPAVFTRAEYEATFTAPKPKPVRNKVTRARDRLVEAMTAVDQAAALLDDTPESRTVAQATADDLRGLHDELTAALNCLPKK